MTHSHLWTDRIFFGIGFFLMSFIAIRPVLFLRLISFGSFKAANVRLIELIFLRVATAVAALSLLFELI
jgi:hypothetical protein